MGVRHQRLFARVLDFFAGGFDFFAALGADFFAFVTGFFVAFLDVCFVEGFFLLVLFPPAAATLMS